MFRKHSGDMFALFESSKAIEKHADLLVVTTNTATTTPDGKPSRRPGPMGAGVALTASTRYPGIQAWWSSQVTSGRRQGFAAMPHGSRWIGCLVTKNDWWKPSTVELIDAGLQELRVWADEHTEVRGIIMSMPGTLNGKLTVSQVTPILEKYLDNRFIVCSLDR